MRLHCSSLLILTSLVFPTVLHGQDKAKGLAEFNEFNAQPIDGWNWDDDERLADLILQLREKESSLEALDARIAKATGRKAGAKMDQNIAWRNNNRMDLNGGGPVRWDVFYGRNAEKFFYHPVDPNTTYHTETLLRQVEPTKAGGVPGNQGTPAHQRPPQFDYIYRGWDAEQQRAREKAEELKGKIDQMISRRRDLERDVVLLWCKLAFRIMDKEKLAEKPVLRWAAIPGDPNKPEDVERAAVLTTATQMLATALLFNDVAVEEDAPKTFGTVGAVIKKSRKAFEDGLLESATLLDESEDIETPLGKYKRLSRKLEDVSKSLTEGYNGWQEGDSNDDEPAKYASLRRIQDSVVTYSQILLSLNELVALMKKGWGTKFNPKSTEFVPSWDVAYTPRVAEPTTPLPLESVGKAEANDQPSDSKLPQSGRVVFLSSLAPQDKQLENGWFDVGKAFDAPIFYNGNACPHSIFLHAKTQGVSSVTYRLGGQQAVFSAGAFVPKVKPEQVNPATLLFFEVVGDGRLLWRSHPIWMMNKMQDCQVPIKNVDRLELRVVCQGSCGWAVAVWHEPHLAGESQSTSRKRQAQTRTTQQLQKSLKETSWQNTNKFIFDWDSKGQVWHKHSDKPNERFPVEIQYVNGNSCAIRLVNNVRQTLLFDEELRSMTQIKENGDLQCGAIRIK